MLRVPFSQCYAECHHFECHYAECRYAECGDAPRGTVGTVKIYYNLKSINSANLALTNPPDYLLTTTKTRG